ncbi:MAG: flagella basal body P-ring formation protein FlgA [Gemmatimonas sp.]|nr:flagella basal body P-ring formation protein FlgA [Gemmatimonas sp.]
MTAHAIGLCWLLLLATAVPSAHAQASAATGTSAAPQATRDLGRGHVLAASDIRADAPDPQGPQLVGWITRRVVRAGEPLRAPAIAPAPLVRAGTPVTVQFVTAGLTVAREGTALTTGAFGDRVHIRLDEHRSLDGVVAGPSMVRIP